MYQEFWSPQKETLAFIEIALLYCWIFILKTPVMIKLSFLIATNNQKRKKMELFLNVCRNKFFGIITTWQCFFQGFRSEHIPIVRLNYYCRYGCYKRDESSIYKFRCLFSVLLNHVHIILVEIFIMCFECGFCDVCV